MNYNLPPLTFEEQTDLLEKYSDIPARVLGFPENWEEHKVWRKENNNA